MVRVWAADRLRGMVQGIWRYLRLWRLFVANSMAQELEYRTAFIAEVMLALTETAWQLVAVWVFFFHRPRLETWTFPEAAVVLGLFIFFDGLMEVFFQPNMRQIIEHIRQGTLDFVLLKPVNAQFLATARHAQFRYIGYVLAGLGLILYSLVRLHTTPHAVNIGLFLLLVGAAAVILYSLLLILVTLAFWFVDVTNILNLIWAVYEAGRVPVDVFPRLVRWVLTFVVPVAFITTVPARTILGRSTPDTLLLAFALAAALFFLSSRFWNYALRQYTSASS